MYFATTLRAGEHYRCDVHNLVGPGGAAVVAADDAFPDVLSNGTVDRWLGAQVLVTRSR